GQLGSADSQRLERHFDEIRSLETRLDAMGAPSQQCVVPPNPGDDPPVGDLIDNPDMYVEGWSNEELRAQLLCDFIHMAFVCDLSRVASLQFTMWKCYLAMANINGVDTDMHSLTHGWTPDSLRHETESVAWFVKHFARLTQKLRDTPEVDGSSVIDHTAM